MHDDISHSPQLVSAVGSIPCERHSLETNPPCAPYALKAMLREVYFLPLSPQCPYICHIHHHVIDRPKPL